MLFKIIKGGKVFTPKYIGVKDVLVAGNLIVGIGDEILPEQSYGEFEIIDANDNFVVPGFIDQHVHIIGGGGEAGYASRTPEVVLSNIIKVGVTTLVGCLGTDGTTRHMSSLLAKARGLEEEGISTYIYTGAYEIPTRTITENVRNDLILIDKIIGTGEIAISDHRSAQPNKEDLKKLAAEARVGGILSGKAGVVHLHVGDGQRGLGMLFEILEETELPISQFKPTHLNRNPKLLEDAFKFAEMGGTIDITSGISPEAGSKLSIKPAKSIKLCLENGVSIENITMSSDGNGSMPMFDENGNVKGLKVSALSSLHREFKDLAKDESIGLEDALKVITANPAKSLKLYPKKGAIKIGSDADIIVLDKNLDIINVIAQGRTMIKEGRIKVKGTFEG